MSEDRVSIYIPKKLYEEVKRRVEFSQSEFKSIEEYVEFILNEIVKEEEQEKTYTPKEEDEIKKRLKNLGYL